MFKVVFAEFKNKTNCFVDAVKSGRVCLKDIVIRRLSFTFTDEKYVVVAEAHWTFTAEAPNLIDTNSILADTRDLPALINIYTKQNEVF